MGIWSFVLVSLIQLIQLNQEYGSIKFSIVPVAEDLDSLVDGLLIPVVV
jgi:hypothetical protein